MLFYATLGLVLFCFASALLVVIVTDARIKRDEAIRQELRDAHEQAERTRARLRGLMAISSASRDRGTPGDVA